MTIKNNTFSVRKIGRLNTLGLWTLFSKEVTRFVKVGFQTLLAPVLSALMFLLIFKFAFGELRPSVNGISYIRFIAPGLIMMGILNQAFANTASSLIISKVQGNAVDFLMPPLSALELGIAFVGGAAVRGLLVGLLSAICMMPFVSTEIAHPLAAIWFGIGAALMMGMVGLLAGIASSRFDHLAAIQNFLLLPLTMLSGTFYSIRVLPEAFQTFSHVNPFFYMIDGFRYGFTGTSDAEPLIGAVMVLIIDCILAICCYLVLRSGWRLKT